LINKEEGLKEYYLQDRWKVFMFKAPLYGGALNFYLMNLFRDLKKRGFQGAEKTTKVE
jgi:hypothetical protein